MKPTRVTTIGLIVLGVALLAWLVLTLASGGSTKTAAAKMTDNRCPNCGRELPRGAAASGECPFCAVEGGSEKARFKRETSLAAKPVIPIALFGLFLLLLGLHVVVVLRTRTGGKRVEVLHHVNCQKCGRRLRYRPSQIGHLAKCPLCQKPILFPKPTEAEKGKRWLKIVHAVWG
jgi:predicted Zn-ribbon and HTH transcriptional regulator